MLIKGIISASRGRVVGIVAITREMGSLGTFIGAEVAGRLSYEFLRQEIIQEASREYRVLEEKLVGAIETQPGLFEAITHVARRYQAFVAAEVLEAALRDRVVIIGRWSTFLLRGIRHAVRVRVCAPLDLRVTRVMERLQIDREEALKRIRTYDEGVRTRIRQAFEVEWDDPLLYDLTINTEQVALETGVSQILELVRAPEFQPTEASRLELLNRALAARVRAHLKANRKTAGVELLIEADRGRVKLSGTVSSEDELEAALRIAGSVEGVQAVDAEVRVLKMPAW